MRYELVTFRVCVGTIQCHFNLLWPLLPLDDIDLELRMARFEHLMDRRPLLLSRYSSKMRMCIFIRLYKARKRKQKGNFSLRRL